MSKPTPFTPYRAVYLGGEDIDLPAGRRVTVLRVYQGADDGQDGEVAKIAYTPVTRNDTDGEGIWEVGLSTLRPTNVTLREASWREDARWLLHQLRTKHRRNATGSCPVCNAERFQSHYEGCLVAQIDHLLEGEG